MILLLLGFLISPLGLWTVVEWLIDRLADLNYFLKDYVMGQKQKQYHTRKAGQSARFFAFCHVMVEQRISR